jgi:hypothetical protein
MDRNELVESLRRAGVPDALYDVPGVHPVPFQLDAYFFLQPVGDAWVVGLRERAQDEVLSRFATEAEACRDLHDRLRAAPRPVPDTEGRIAAVVARADEIRRQAWEEFARARRAATEPGDA